MNESRPWLNLQSRPAAEPDALPELYLQAVSTRSGPEVIPSLMDAIDRASGWVLHRQMVSASMVQLRIEVQGRSLMDLYASLLEQGLDLSRESHLLLTERCSCAHLHRRTRSGIVALHMDLQLPGDVPLLGQWWDARIA